MGTPVSNSMTEIYSMQKYLQSKQLRDMGMKHFDCWAASFGETVTQLELAAEGTGYRPKTRFAKFYNLPELMTMFKECADIKTADMLDLEIPECTVHNVSVEPTQSQSELVKSLSERAAAVHNRVVAPEEDNMLKITTDGRKIGLDQRLINPMLPDEPGTKVNVCTANVFRIWDETSENKSAQLIFCDYSTPKGDGSFNLYDDIRQKLIAKGVPAEEIAFIHDAKNEVQKEELFAKVRDGSVRILIGSTMKMGAGTNVQDKLIASHDLDCPWKPSDMEQRRGRMVRQGNTNKHVELYRYVTKNTFDAYLFQTLENKQKFISQIMTSKSPVRSCEDLDEAALSYAEVKALCAGDPRIKEKMDLDVQVARLRVMRGAHMNNIYSLEDAVAKQYPQKIAQLKAYIHGCEQDIKTFAGTKPPLDSEGKERFSIVLNGNVYTDKEAAGSELIRLCTAAAQTESRSAEIGEYRGFRLSVSMDIWSREFTLKAQGQAKHKFELGNSPEGNIRRLDNLLEGIPKKLESAKEQLSGVETQLESAKREAVKPFPQEDELKEKSERLIALNSELNLGEADNEGALAGDEQPLEKAAASEAPDEEPGRKVGMRR